MAFNMTTGNINPNSSYLNSNLFNSYADSTQFKTNNDGGAAGGTGGGADMMGMLGGALGSATGMGMIGPGINIAAGIINGTRTRETPKVNRGALDSMRTTVNINPQLEQNASDFKGMRESIGQQQNGPQGSSSLNALYSNKLRANSKLYGEKFNQETKLRNNKANLEAKFDTIDHKGDMSRYQSQLVADDNSGIAGNFSRAGFADLGSAAQMLETGENQKNTDLFMAALTASAQAGETGIDERLMQKIMEMLN